ncbi:MAG TPA: protein translocase subunit SecF [Spirochaetia bacterium]|nr:protein translocase subunit SecF [Spirochaetia bacterium]
MKRVIRFSRARYYFFGFSGTLILIGILGLILNHGFNLGVDFRAGLSIQFHIAPRSLAIQYTGPDSALLDVPAGEQALTAAGNIIITTTAASNGAKTSYPFKYSDYASISALADGIRKVPGVTVDIKGDATLPPSDLLPLVRPADITGKAAYLNLNPAVVPNQPVTISDVRSTLDPMGEHDLQAVGAPANQEFISRVATTTEDQSFQTTTQNKLTDLLSAKYGAEQVIIESTEFVGPRMAQALTTQTMWLVLIAIVLILVYMMFRFHPAIYAVAAVLGILHDAVIMLGFDAVFRVQVDAGTIAAILTILGYSINDTIVNFDRARENLGLMRGESLRTILDTSVTQTLSRTFITSGATMLTVVALFILTSGSIKNFAFNMIVGIAEGTYSTFISAFIVIEWTTARDRRRKSAELGRYGISEKSGAAEGKLAMAGAVAASGAPMVTAQVAAAEEAEESVEDEAEGADGAVREPAADGRPTDADTPTGDGDGAQATTPAGGQSGQPTAGQTVARPANVMAFPGNTGSRKHKKHRRRHH